ncbi:hypothetical protein [Flagellimonas onchidii]|uniref:GapS4b family protein n=1 Tax=Flagellimonas onchidii TaxID=2562684 RepID=UPI0010A66E23|nr:hypothetical protein [Allomuricauda onchidii]
MDLEINNEEKDFDFLLPNGEILRTILVRPELTDGNLKTIVKSKGIFLSKYEKEDTVPVLMRTLLSPEEYDTIREMQKFKIERLKYRTTQLPWQGSDDLLSHIPNEFSLHNILEEKYTYEPGFKLIGVPSFTPVDNRKDKIELKFTVEEQSDIKSIHNRKKEYEGSLIIELKSDGHLHLHSTKSYTSQGTQDLVDSVANKLEKHFKAEGSVKKEDSYERIMFQHFGNVNRFTFFMKFLDDIGFLKFKKIVDISVSPDPDKEIPEDAKAFMKDIENLNIRGKSLRRHILISEQKYRDSILLLYITAQYEFAHSEGKGICEVEYAFPDYRVGQNDNPEFQFYLGKILVDRNYRAFAKKNKIEKSIYEDIDSHKMYHYNSLKL